MAANATVPTAKELRAHLVKHDWTKREAKAFIDRHASLLGEATYDEWEDLSVAYIEANA